MAQSSDPAHGNDSQRSRFDPISVASAALNSPEEEPEQEQPGGFLSRFRARSEPADSGQRREDLPPDSWGRVGSGKESLDPLAVTRRALSSEHQDPDAADAADEADSGTPLRERLGSFVERARAAITPDPKSEETDPSEPPSPSDAPVGPDAATGSAPSVQASEPSRPEGDAAPESSSSDQESGPDDPGWVFHRKADEDGFEGWLYHYADGTMVDESGVVYEYPSHESDALDHDPSVAGESASGTGAEERTGEAPSRVAGQDTAESPAPDSAEQSPAFAEAAQGALATEEAQTHDATSETEDESAEQQAAESDSEAADQIGRESDAPAAFAEAAHASQEQVVEQASAEENAEPDTDEDTTDEENAPADDASTDDADENDASPDDGSPGDGSPGDGSPGDGSPDTGADQENATADTADQEPERTEETADEDAPMPEVEGSGGPLAAVTETVTGAWLNEKAAGKQALPAEEDDSTAEERSNASAPDEPETVYIPRFIEYSPSNLLRYLSGGLFAVASIAAVMTIFYAVQAASGAYVVLGGVFILVALLAAWVLLSWEPTVISIREGILEVAKGPHGDQVDLRDPRTKVDLGSNVGSPLWRMTVHRAGDSDLKINAGQVKARQFAAIVEHHLRHPRKKPQAESED